MPVIVEGITSEQLGRTTAEWVKQATIDTAIRALRVEVARGFDNEPVVITDGVARRDYLQVKPFGRIEFAARPDMATAVLWAMTELQKKSPFRSGRYVRSHFVMINGAEIAGNIALALRNVKAGDRVQIVNPQPYAKKIEGRKGSRKRGFGGERGLSSQARSGVYRVVQRALVNRFGRTMFFDFKYVKLSTGVQVKGYAGGGRANSRAGRWLGLSKRRRVMRDLVYPCLQFFIKPTEIPN